MKISAADREEKHEKTTFCTDGILTAGAVILAHGEGAQRFRNWAALYHAAGPICPHQVEESQAER
jgi:hypothetical protein